MVNDFDRILDECIDRINRGEDVSFCLTAFPEHAERLRPVLQSVARTRAAYVFTPSAEAKRKARQILYGVAEKRKRGSFLRSITRPAVWVPVAVVAVVVAVGLTLFRSIIFPVGQISQPTIEPTIIPAVIAAPSPDGNFAFLVSDEVNAITDFSSLNVTIDTVDLHKAAGDWVEITPDVIEFDLSLLPGDKTQELWRGNVPEGDYDRVVITVSAVTGTLKSSGQTIEIKLPSEKLQLLESFTVGPQGVTSFVYDLTVVKTGDTKNGGKYLLKPQVGTSGTTISPTSAATTAASQPSQGKNQDKSTPRK
jgi:hypothetical protein